MENNSQIITKLIDQNDTSEMHGMYLTFWTDSQLYGVPIAHVLQIVGMQNITQVPEFPHYAKGVINLRGSIIPLIDARLRLGKQEAEYNERTCIIVTNISEHSVGVIVDEVDAVITIDDAAIAPPPQMTNTGDGYITGIGKLDGKIVLLMNICKILGSDELELLVQDAQ